MAIARGAGTEIIRSASFEHCNDTAQAIIIGVPHHIYTVLSVSMFHETMGAPAAAFLQLYLTNFLLFYYLRLDLETPQSIFDVFFERYNLFHPYVS